MSKNDQTLLEHLLHSQREQLAPELNDTDFFELFVANQVLKNRDLSYDEIEAGIVDGGGDGGIDAFYTIIDEQILSEDFDFSIPKKNCTVDVIIIQSKTSKGFGEMAIERLISVSRDLFDLEQDLDDFSTVYNKQVLKAAELFREAQRNLISKFPKLRFLFFYASKGVEVHKNVSRKAEDLKCSILGLFSDATFNFEFLTATKLLSLARTEPSQVHELRVTESPISTGNVGYVCLVSLSNFFRFITDENGKLQRRIFEANVRDYQGKTEVNSAIKSSLEEPQDDEDFWWLNNGISILCSQASLSGKTLALEDPQIVNGLQTSTEIYAHFGEEKREDHNRTLLVRVVVPPNPSSNDRIIRATNSQTAIPTASLRATDKIHRDLEEYFSSKGLYYDRRKNYYKNQGKPKNKIVGIPYVAQAVTAILLGQPNDARARPSSLLKKDDQYARVFDPKRPIEHYFQAVELQREVDTYLQELEKRPFSSKNNLKFHLAFLVFAWDCEEVSPKGQKLEAFLEEMEEDHLDEGLEILTEIMEDLDVENVGEDKIAKSPEFLKKIQEYIRNKP